MDSRVHAGEEELRALFTSTKRKVPIFKLGGVICTFLSVCASVMIDPYFGALLMLISIGVSVYLITKCRRRLKNALAADMIPAALSGRFDDFEYLPDRSIDGITVKETDMGFPFSSSRMDMVSGNDLVRGEYKGVGFETSDIEILEKRENANGDTSAVNIFRGQWLICDFGKELTADVILSENLKKKKPGKDSILTDSDEFNRYYDIRSENEEEVFYLLTPHMMEFIISMDKRASGNTYLHFMRNGKVHIAVNSGRNLFEVNKLRGVSYDSLMENIKREADYIADLIDELRISDSMYLK